MQVRMPGLGVLIFGWGPQDLMHDSTEPIVSTHTDRDHLTEGNTGAAQAPPLFAWDPGVT